MYPVSSEYKAEINSGDSRSWRIKLDIQTAFELLELTENDIKIDSMTLKERVVNGSSFSIGGCVPADFSVTIINQSGEYDGVQLNGSTLRPYVGLMLGPDSCEWIPLGVFTADNVEGSIISTPDSLLNGIKLQAGDNLIKLDCPFSKVPVTFPCSVLTLLTSVCGYCGVPLATTSFLHDDYIIAAQPEGDMSCRDIVAHIAEMAAGWARCNRLGQLEIVWFKNPAPIQEAVIDGNVDSVDGGDFTSWNTISYDGGVFDEAEPDIVLDGTGRYDFTISDAPIILTGVSFERDDDILLAGSARYAIHVSDNPLIQDNAEDVIQAIWARLRGFAFLPYSTYRRDDPAIQAGDMVKHVGVGGREYRSIITGYDYVYGGRSLITAAGASEAAAGYRSSMSKTVSQLRRKIAEKQIQLDEKQVMLDALDLAIVSATNLIAGALGGHAIQGEGDYKGNFFIADNPDITQAVRVWRWNIGGFGYSDNGVDGPYETAITADKTIIANALLARIITGEMIEANSITGDHIQAGTITGDKLQADTVEANKLKSAGSNVYAKIGQAAVPSNQPGLALYSTNDIIRALIAATPGSLSLWVYPPSGDYPVGSSLTAEMDYVHLATGNRKTDIRLYQDAIYFRVNGQPYGVNGATPTGQKPVFENGICIGFTT